MSLLCLILSLFLLNFLPTNLAQNIVAPSATPSATIEVLQPAAYAGKNRLYVVALTGNSLVLECQVTNRPLNALVIWQVNTVVLLANGTEIVMANSTTTISKDYNSNDMSRWRVGLGRQTNSYRLEIDSMTFDNDGLYTCKIDYSADTDPITPSIRIKVYQAPSILPSWTSNTVTKKSGDSVSLQCNASGVPSPYLSWSRVGGPSALIPGYGKGYDGTTLTMDNVQPDSRGTYVCAASNVVGGDRWRIDLYILFDPLVRVQETNPKQAIGYNKQLMCIITGNPIPTESQVKFLLNGNPIVNSRRTRIDFNEAADFTVYYTLNLQPVQASDFGTYSCEATTTGTGRANIVLSQSDTPTYARPGVIQGANSLGVSHLLAFASLLTALFTIVLFRA